MSTHPTPDDPDDGPRFDPTDPADLETFRAQLSARTGREWTTPEPFEFPADAGDPNAGWMTYPEDPHVRHHDRATRTVIDVSFPGSDSFSLFGWVRAAAGCGMRVVHRTGRYHRAGPAALAWVIARLLARELGEDGPAIPDDDS